MREFTTRPTPGKWYKVTAGDSLSKMASISYGDLSKYPLIRDANAFMIGRDEDLIYPGESFYIPSEKTRETIKRQAKETISGKEKTDCTLVISGREIPVMSAAIIRTMDTLADGWTASISWTPGLDAEIDRITAPYSYSPAAVYLGGRLVVNGLLYNTTHSLSNSGQTKDLEGFSFTADAIDSTVRPPYEKNKVDLLQRCKDLLEPLDINASIADGADIGGAFKRVTAKPDQTIFAHLADLAKQRGLLLTSDKFGDLLIVQAKTVGDPVGTLSEGGAIAQGFSIKFDGRARWNTYRAIGQSPKSNTNAGISIDPAVSRPRFLTFSATDADGGDIIKAAEWRKNKTVADALTMPFPVTSWYDPNGDLWQENTLVTIESETIGCPNGFTFLIKQVTFKFDTAGNTADLSLVPPGVYTKGKIDEPWLIGGVS